MRHQSCETGFFLGAFQSKVGKIRTEVVLFHSAMMPRGRGRHPVSLRPLQCTTVTARYSNAISLLCSAAFQRSVILYEMHIEFRGGT